MRVRMIAAMRMKVGSYWDKGIWLRLGTRISHFHTAVCPKRDYGELGMGEMRMRMMAAMVGFYCDGEGLVANTMS